MLRARAAEVDAVDAELRGLADAMFDAMYEAEGVGLAANQVGVTKRLIVLDPRVDDIEPVALVNPRVVTEASERDRAEEGCLSMPGLREVVERPASVTVEALDLEGRPVQIEAVGLHARVLQHEIDHLDGVLFFDRVSPLKRRLLLKRWEKSRYVAEGGGM